jgi:aminotransferase in exopolysaccharide biosynthesis
MISSIIKTVKSIYLDDPIIPLHRPFFRGSEKQYIYDTIESTYVSSVGKFVDRFENDITNYTKAEASVAVVNGTAALHIALLLAGVTEGDYVITQPLTFVATCNAIAYCKAVPIFIDVDKNRMSLSPSAVESWLENNSILDHGGICRHKLSQKPIRAAVVMHTFGHPADMDNIKIVCDKWNIKLIEDAAEGLGSKYKGDHVGTISDFGVLSFNGNKIITTGGGGMLLSKKPIASIAKHITTTAKIPHEYIFDHDQLGYNYRMPNINAALGCAQIEQLDFILSQKRKVAKIYQCNLKNSNFIFISEPNDSCSNYWLNGIICHDSKERDAVLHETNKAGVTTRPVWKLMHRLPMYNKCPRGDLTNAEWLENRIVNLPSSVPSNKL